MPLFTWELRLRQPFWRSEIKKCDDPYKIQRQESRNTRYFTFFISYQKTCMYIYMKETKTTTRRNSNTFFTNMNMIVLSCWGLSDAAPILQLQRAIFTTTKMMIVMVLLRPCTRGTNSSAAATGLCISRDIHVCTRPSFQSRLQLHTPPAKDAWIHHSQNQIKKDALFYVIKVYILPGKYCIWCHPHPRPIQWVLLLMDICFSSGTSTGLLLRLLCSLNPSSLPVLIIPVEHEQHLINRTTKKGRDVIQDTSWKRRPTSYDMLSISSLMSRCWS